MYLNDKTCRLQVRVSPKTLGFLDEYAERCGLTKAEVVRSLIESCEAAYRAVQKFDTEGAWRESENCIHTDDDSVSDT